MLTREQILTADDRPSEIVQVPEWGGEVKVTTMSGTQRDAFERSLNDNGKVDTSNARAKFAAAVLVDEPGNALFSADDISALGAKSAAALDRVMAAAQRLNKLSTEELEATKGN